MDDLFTPFEGDYVLPVFPYMIPLLQAEGGLDGLLAQLTGPVVVTGSDCRMKPATKHVYVREETVRTIREMVTMADEGGASGGLSSAPGALWDYMRQAQDPDIVTHVKVWAVIDAAVTLATVKSHRESAAILPGLWRCPKCGYVLSKRIVSPSGVVADSRLEREECPTDGALMVQVTEGDVSEEEPDPRTVL